MTSLKRSRTGLLMAVVAASLSSVRGEGERLGDDDRGRVVFDPFILQPDDENKLLCTDSVAQAVRASAEDCLRVFVKSDCQFDVVYIGLGGTDCLADNSVRLRGGVFDFTGAETRSQSDVQTCVRDAMVSNLCLDWLQGPFSGTVSIDYGRESPMPSAGPALPSVAPTISPVPSLAPSTLSSLSPTGAPSMGPSSSPVAQASLSPSVSPSWTPSGAPTATPSSSPTAVFSSAPSAAPSMAPSMKPSFSGSAWPSSSASASPSAVASSAPSSAPTTEPTGAPTGAPTDAPVSRGVTGVENDQDILSADEGRNIPVIAAASAGGFLVLLFLAALSMKRRDQEKARSVAGISFFEEDDDDDDLEAGSKAVGLHSKDHLNGASSDKSRSLGRQLEENSQNIVVTTLPSQTEYDDDIDTGVLVVDEDDATSRGNFADEPESLPVPPSATPLSRNASYASSAPSLAMTRSRSSNSSPSRVSKKNTPSRNSRNLEAPAAPAEESPSKWSNPLGIILNPIIQASSSLLTEKEPTEVATNSQTVDDTSVGSKEKADAFSPSGNICADTQSLLSSMRTKSFEMDPMESLEKEEEQRATTPRSFFSNTACL